jgi:hypothetical protein
MWIAENKLSLNTSKTFFMTFGTYRDSVPQEISIYINETKISRTTNTKYLEIMIDCHLKWDSHVQYIIKKTHYLLFIFN